MKRALGEYLVIGISTSIPFHQALMDDEHFRNGDIHTLYVEENEILDRGERPTHVTEATSPLPSSFIHKANAPIPNEAAHSRDAVRGQHRLGVADIQWSRDGEELPADRPGRSRGSGH